MNKNSQEQRPETDADAAENKLLVRIAIRELGG